MLKLSLYAVVVFILMNYLHCYYDRIQAVTANYKSMLKATIQTYALQLEMSNKLNSKLLAPGIFSVIFAFCNARVVIYRNYLLKFLVSVINPHGSVKCSIG